MNNESIRNQVANSTDYDKGEKGSVTGLHVRVSATGARSFYLYYRTASGQQRRPKLGKFGELTIAQARAMAREMLIEVARGNDPKGATREANASPTLAKVYDRALKEYWSTERFEESKWKANVESFWKTRIEGAFAEKRMNEITPLKIKAWMDTMADTPIGANRAFGVLRRIFAFAEQNEIIPLGTNPCSVVKAFPEKSRKRYASAPELAALSKALDEREWKNPYGVAFVRIMLHTGSRPSALARMTWDQIKVIKTETGRHGIYTFFGKGTGASGEEETLLLTEHALKILEGLPKRPDGKLLGNNPVKLWRGVRKEIGASDLWLRDLRRTYATAARSAGVDMNTIADLLNHKSEQTTKIYAKLARDSQIDAAAKVSEWMEKGH